jgi:hypothetical protein
MFEKLLNSQLRPVTAFLILLPVFALVGCSLLRQNDAVSTIDPSSVTPTFPTVTRTPTSTPSPTPTPEPTPIPRVVRVSEQSIDEEGILLIDMVSLPTDGWLAIYRQTDGNPGEVIGQTALAAGEHADVQVSVDPSAVTEIMYAGLHMDVGTKGVFEFPGEDEPWPGEPRTRLTVEVLLPTPLIEVADQAVGEDGLMTVQRVEVVEPSWVLIHRTEDGQIGRPIGRILLEPGIHEDVVFAIHWREATPTLSAVLYEDRGETGRLELENSDRPILINGEPVTATFQATYPPHILVHDQPVVEGAILVERVISNGPGWLAVYYDEGGQPGLIIGSALLVDGLNENVSVNVIESAVTPQLYLRLHEDSEPGDPFGFPAEDPVVLYNNRLPPATPLRTDAGAHVMVDNQPAPDDERVTVRRVITPIDTWVAVHLDDEGQPGRMIGRTLVAPGVNQDVQIELDPGWVPGSFHIVLYRDLGEPGRFDALGVDPFLTNGDSTVVRVPFTLYPLNE